jgi:WD40 repeat protein
VSDDDKPSRHMINKARRHEAKPQPPTPAVSRAARFFGEFPNTSWLAIGWALDGSQVALGGKNAKGAGVLEIWNGQSGHHEGHSMRHLTHEVVGPVISLAWSPDGTHLVTVEDNVRSGQREVRVRSKAEAARVLNLPQNLTVSQVACSPDGAMFALSGAGGGAVLVDFASGMVRRVLDGLSGPVAWAPEGRLIAGTDGTSVVLCDPDTGERVRELTGQQHVPASIAWARHGRYLAVADGEDIRVWDTETGKRLWKMPWVTSEGDRGPDGSVTAVEWLDGGHYLMEFRKRGGARRDEWGSTISTSTLWDTETGKTVFIELFYEHLPSRGILPMAATALTPDGRRISHAVDHIAPTIWQINSDLPHWLP